MKETKRRWVAAELDEEVHGLLWRYSTELGEHPSHIIETFIIDGLEAAAEAEDNPSVDMRAFMAVRRAIHREQGQARLERLAWAALKRDDTEAFDDLQTLCLEYGISTEEIMDTIEMRDTPPILISDNGHGIGSAMIWLKGYIEAAGEVKATDAIEQGERMGFTSSTVNSAKRKLGLRSVRRSSCWTWVSEEKAGRIAAGQDDGDHHDDEPF